MKIIDVEWKRYAGIGFQEYVVHVRVYDVIAGRGR